MTNAIRTPSDWRFGRIREDIDAGRLWKARDRLQGHLRESPADQDVLDVLGAVWFAMGDLPQAGRHWWLTERGDDDAIRARAAFYERYGSKPRGVLRALPRPARPEHYPDSVRARLEELVAAANTKGTTWRPSDWKSTAGDPVSLDDSRPRRDEVIAVLVTLALIALLLVGLLNTVAWVLNLAF